jgi:hypothetical protein
MTDKQTQSYMDSINYMLDTMTSEVPEVKPPEEWELEEILKEMDLAKELILLSLLDNREDYRKRFIAKLTEHLNNIIGYSNYYLNTSKKEIANNLRDIFDWNDIYEIFEDELDEEIEAVRQEAYNQAKK